MRTPETRATRSTLLTLIVISQLTTNATYSMFRLVYGTKAPTRILLPSRPRTTILLQAEEAQAGEAHHRQKGQV